MIFTKGLLIEQIKRRVNGGNPSAPTKFTNNDIALHLGNAINTRLKADFLMTLSMGETIPEGCQLLSYSGDYALNVLPYGENFSVVQLPTMPVKLMRDMGVAWVSRDGDEGEPFIWVPNGHYAAYTRQKLINDLLGQIGYSVSLDKLIIYKNLAALSVSKIMVKLVAADVFSLGDYDALPITAEMHGDVVQEVFDKLVNTPAKDNTNDVTTVKQ